MATMNRNTNLEEINTDALMGIPFLNHQTTGQKLIFFGSLVLGIALNLLCNFALHVNMMVSILLTLLPIIIGIVYGCNYNEDLSLMQYFKLIMLKPSKTYYSKSTEDIVYLRAAEERIRMEEHQQEMSQQRATPEAQRKMLIKLIVGIVVSVIAFVALLLVLMSTKTEEIHHTAMRNNSVKEWEMLV